MSDPRRNDDARLSTADLAAATDGSPQTTVPQPDARVPADRDVTRRPGMVADAPSQADLEEHPTSLFAENEAEDLRRRWTDIQTGFVDEPRKAVEHADALVAEAMKRLAEIFAQERDSLEQQWARGADVSTEDLRVALRRYRGFFDRLLSV